MRAAWYEHRGPAAKTLVVGEMPDVEPGGGEVRIKVDVSGLSPGDVKKRSGWQGSPMPYPREIPTQRRRRDDRCCRVGRRSGPHRTARACVGAQSYRAFGTAAEYVAVPDALAITLPHGADADADRVLAEQAACLGIAGITGYRAVFADGSVRGLHVLVHGATGGLGSSLPRLRCATARP